jgi:zinc/manganese transport system permease protein
MIDILMPAFVISFVLVGIHAYFGIRIIKRNIIFTDLAIGQMAALGAAMSLLFFHGSFMYIISLVSALLAGAAIFMLSDRSSHPEAVIGLMYAFGFSGVYILLSKSPHGAEEFSNLMAYDILFTGMSSVIKTGILYIAIGFLLVIISRIKGRLNDLLFFLTFAVTVTSSVKIAGVLVVFAILLAPAFIAVRITEIKGRDEFPVKKALFTAWGTGLAINIAAIIISYFYDFPTGYTIVFINAFASIPWAFIDGKSVIKNNSNKINNS